MGLHSSFSVGVVSLSLYVKTLSLQGSSWVFCQSPLLLAFASKSLPHKAVGDYMIMGRDINP